MASKESNRHRIEPQLSLLNAISITTATIIGSGIFISPKGVYQSLGSVGLSFVFWIVGGIVTLLGNLCWVELALAMPKFGGEYLYLREIYGEFPAFVFQWLSFFITFPASVAVVALTFSEYVLAPVVQHCDVPPISLGLVSVVMIVFSAYINVISVRASKMIVNFLMAAKLLALGVIIIAGVVFLFTRAGEVVSFDNSFDNIKWTNFGLAFYAVGWAYGGGNTMMSMTEEFRNPKRDFPIAIFVSNIAVIAIYVLANVAYFAVLSPSEILLSNAVAVTFSEKALGSFRWLIPVFVAFSTITIQGFLAKPRSYYATARDGMFPQVLAMISIKYKTPVGTIVINCILSLIYLFVNDIWKLITYCGFANAFCDALALSTILVMRWYRQDIHKPFTLSVLHFCFSNTMMSMTEEFRNPKRDFPIAIFVSNIAVIAIYVLANVAYFAVLSPSEILLSNAVAVTFSEKALGSFRWLIPVFVAFSTITIQGFLAKPRSYYATARDGMFPQVLAMISIKYKTPVGTIVINCILSLIYLFVNDIWKLITYCGFANAFCDALALSTILVMRWYRQDIHKPFTVPLVVPLIAIATACGGVVLVAMSAPLDALVGVGLTLTSVPAYLIGVYPRTKVPLAGKISGAVTRIFQMITVSSPEDDC